MSGVSGLAAAQRAEPRDGLAVSPLQAKVRAMRSRYAARSPEQIESDRARLRPDGVKRCPRCRQWLPVGDFASKATSPDGLMTYCRPCRATQNPTP